jgi:hypothetical protein
MLALVTFVELDCSQWIFFLCFDLVNDRFVVIIESSDASNRLAHGRDRITIYYLVLLKLRPQLFFLGSNHPRIANLFNFGGCL